MPSLAERQQEMQERLASKRTNRVKVEVIKPRPQALSPQERACIQGIFEGKSNRQIAEALQVREQVVKNYLHRAYATLGITDVRQLFPLVIAGNFELRTGQAVQTQ